MTVPHLLESEGPDREAAKREYRKQLPALRVRLLEAQARLREADFPVIVLFSGVDGAGKGDLANRLSEWMDPRSIATVAFGPPSDEERARPEYWRFWRALPPTGTMGVFLSAWYHRPLLERVYDATSREEFDGELEQILSFERALRDGGALIVKFWLHLGRKAQKRRFEELEANPDQSWRVTKTDWKHWRMYPRFVRAAEHLLDHTGRNGLGWHVVDGANLHRSSLEIGNRLAEALEGHLDTAERAAPSAAPPPLRAHAAEPIPASPALASLDMSQRLERVAYKRQLDRERARLNRLFRRTRERGLSVVLAFEGWDAAGKGGAIRRLTGALDGRDYRVVPIAAPTDEERRHHYLWRFWRHLPAAGRILIFDRSWYGRVLVERVEGHASEPEWRRAYGEINEFERQLIDHGTVLAKFLMHITPDEQAARFRERQQVLHKRWKLTHEDWRNRSRWAHYEAAAQDMIDQTSTPQAPWTLVEANDKRFARIKVLKTLCQVLERALGGEEKD